MFYKILFIFITILLNAKYSSPSSIFKTKNYTKTTSNATKINLLTFKNELENTYKNSNILRVYEDPYCTVYWGRCTGISVVLGFIILCTIVGNSFVIAAVVLERNLHNVANYLIVSLAVADLMVAITVSILLINYLKIT